MLPPGRRRMAAMSPLTLYLAFLLLFTSTASAAVLGIDFGTLNIKAAIVKPGIPLDIVLTKDSKRKEVAALAFKPIRDEKNKIVTKVGTFPERAYGSDALSLQGRLPGEVFPNLKLLLGLQWGSEGNRTASIYQQRYPGVQLQQVQELGTTVFKSAAFADEVMPFSVEELIGMQLANIKRNAEAMAGKGSVVDDAVIAIPAFYTADEKQAIVKAANFAGLEVMSLITDGMAVGLDYAKTRSFPETTKGETPEYHLVFDMGAGSTTATVMRFQSRSVKDTGRFNKTIQEVQVLGAGWDRTLGGDALNHVIMEDFVRKLLTKPVLKSRGTTEDEVKKNGRVMSRFFKEAERARQILSANTETSAGFEEILPDIDLRVKLTRAEFEQLADGFSDRVETPIVDALKMAKLEMKDLKSIILHGGAVRTPFVQSKLEKLVDDEAKLRSNVNPDESAVFGAAFKAASLSASFKVKEIRALDTPGYAATMVYTDNGKERRQTLFGANAPFGTGSTTKQVTFKDKEDFTFGFVQTVAGAERTVVRVQSENLTSSVQELIRRAGCDKEAIDTKFSIRLGPTHGLPDVSGGSVSCEVDEEAKPGSIGDSVKGWLGFGKKDQEPLSEAGEDDGPVEKVDATSSSVSTSSSPSASSASASSSKAVETPTTRIEVVPLKWSVSPQGNPQPSKEQIVRIKERLQQFDQSDKARYMREEAQNVLEAYTYFVRDFLENKDNEGVSTKQERGSISELLKLTRDWMESGEPVKATKEILKEKHEALKKLVTPIQLRRTEGTNRPELIKNLQKSLDKLQKGMVRIESQAAKASASIQSAAAAASSSLASASSTILSSSETTESASASETPAADPDDLEEPIPSEASSISTSEPPKPTESVAINPYDIIDFTAINETYNSISQWLEEKLAEQAKLKPHENPVLLGSDVEKKAAELGRTLEDLVSKAARAGKASIKKPKSTKSKTAKKAKATAADADADAEDVPPEVLEAARKLREQQAGDDDDEGGKPVKGSESIDDMMNWLKKAKPVKKAAEAGKEDRGHEEL